MTKGTLIEIAISFLGIALLIGVSWLFGAMRSVVVTKEAAAERLKFDEPDFKTGEWLIGADGRSAAALSANGAETALVLAVGDGLATRRFRHGGVGLERFENTLIFRLGEPSLRTVRLAAPDRATAEQWILRLAGPRL